MSGSNEYLINPAGYAQAEAKIQRAMAVDAALQLISKRAAMATANGLLTGELANLSAYADTIQAALDKSKT